MQSKNQIDSSLMIEWPESLMPICQFLSKMAATQKTTVSSCRTPNTMSGWMHLRRVNSSNARARRSVNPTFAIRPWILLSHSCTTSEPTWGNHYSTITIILQCCYGSFQKSLNLFPPSSETFTAWIPSARVQTSQRPKEEAYSIPERGTKMDQN